VAGADRQDSGGAGLNGALSPVGRVLLVGASGLIGTQVPDLLQTAHPGLGIDLLLRKPVPEQTGREIFCGDPLTLALAEWQRAHRRCDAFFCALGTTRRAAGSLQAFAAIDRDLVVSIAKAAAAAGARQAIVVSSVGADARSRNDYLRVKGEMQDALAGVGFERCDFLQPSLLLGPRRAAATRFAESLGQRLAPLFKPLLPGRLRRYRAIAATEVARAAAALLGRTERGIHFQEFDALRALARGQSAP
jgi:uncharacterized protein YbjT (DUF2867 family)